MEIEITLQADFWNSSPIISTGSNGTKYADTSDFVNGALRKIRFNVDVTYGSIELSIIRKNKSIKDTIIQDGKIVKDSIVKIIDIVADGISLEPLLDKGEFWPIYPEPWYTQQNEKGNVPPVSYKYCRTIHHNGEWKFQFESPVHIWFFQNINVEI